MTRTPDSDIAAVLFDLDDTLFPQASWLAHAWSAVAREAREHGVNQTALSAALSAVAAEGSDRGRIIDRALDRIGAPQALVDDLVVVFRAHRPAVLEPYPGVRQALARLRAVVRLGLVSDGDVGIQRGKLEALGMTTAFDVVVYSDELGRHRRKPDPAPFRLALERLGVVAAEAVFVGDRPDKDVAGGRAAGMRTIRVLTGEYADAADLPQAWLTTSGVAEAAEVLFDLGLGPDNGGR